MEALKSSLTCPITSIDNRLKSIAQADISKNGFITKCMAETILLCGKHFESG
jgi:hypothetical protein